jgi:hypothetical protein
MAQNVDTADALFGSSNTADDLFAQVVDPADQNGDVNTAAHLFGQHDASSHDDPFATAGNDQATFDNRGAYAPPAGANGAHGHQNYNAPAATGRNQAGQNYYDQGAQWQGYNQTAGQGSGAGTYSNYRTWHRHYPRCFDRHRFFPIHCQRTISTTTILCTSNTTDTRSVLACDVREQSNVFRVHCCIRTVRSQ